MILLDTSVLINLVFGHELSPASRQVMQSNVSGLAVSVITAWEIGLLATRTGRTGPQIGDGRLWFAAAVRASGVRVLPLTEPIALLAAYLPGDFHADPSDRMIVATACIEKMSLITSDRRILAYAGSGYLAAIAA